MSYKCDKCGKRMETFGASYRLSLDFRQNEPDHPPKAGNRNGHLCKGCRGEFRDFIAYDGDQT